MTITISHNRTDGTLVNGTAKGDGAGAILRHNGFRPSRNLPGGAYWYLPHTRDRAAKRLDLDRAADALRAAGFDVSVEIDDATPSAVSFADREAERYDRAEDRVERYGERADRASSAGAQMWDRVRQQREQVPLGQPMMPDHHSYAADCSRRDRWNRQESRAAAEMDRESLAFDEAPGCDRGFVMSNGRPRCPRSDVRRAEQAAGYSTRHAIA